MRFYPFLATAALSGLVLSVSGAAEPDLNVGAHVDKSEVATGQVLTFAITISGPIRHTPKVQLTSFQGFKVISTGQSQQIQIRQGRAQQSLTLSYALAPMAPGSYTLGPVKIEYEGKTYETQPIEVKVVAGSPIPEEKKEPSESTQLEGGVIL